MPLVSKGAPTIFGLKPALHAKDAPTIPKQNWREEKGKRGAARGSRKGLRVGVMCWGLEPRWSQDKVEAGVDDRIRYASVYGEEMEARQTAGT